MEGVTQVVGGNSTSIDNYIICCQNKKYSALFY